jgi:hypothetical protein
MRPILALAAASALGLAGAARADAVAPTPLPLEGAAFGMSVAAWKALPVPASAGPTAVPACWANDKAVTIPGYRLSAEDRRTDLVTCTYVSRFGHDVLPHSVVLDQRYRATGLRFLFAQGRLAEVEFRASIDAYNDVTAMLYRRFGEPTQAQRHVVALPSGPSVHVRETWSGPYGRVTLTDPSADRTQLGVNLRLAPSRS